MTLEAGMTFTGDDAQGRPRLSWLYVVGSDKPTLAWLTFLKRLKKKGLAGPSKQSRGTLPTGFKKNTGEPMESYHVRGFLTLLLSPKQNKRIKDIEKSLPLGRYLTGCEICRLMNLEKQEPIPDERRDAMEDCFQEWKQTRTFQGLSDNEGWAAWMDWVTVKYAEPLTIGSPSPWDK